VEAIKEEDSRQRGWRLVLLSCLMLFLELALIRLASAHNVYVRFLTNFVLLASFLGIGIGFLRAEEGRRLFRRTPALLLALVLFVVLLPVEQGLGSSGRALEGMFGTSPLPSWISLPVLFILVATVMAAVAGGVARVFVTFRPLHAYRLDILGSILGVVLFTMASFLRLPPVVWVLVVAALFAAALGERVSVSQWTALAAVVVLLGTAGAVSGDIWSPYYRVSVGDRQADARTPIRVNGLRHQSIWRVEDLVVNQPFYEAAYGHLPPNPLSEVLVIGAGNGNDVAIALSRGAGHVDAVEIDPVLADLGRARHPDRPYQDPRVAAFVQDGRAFLERTGKRYDLVLFALPDSLVLVAGQGSLRLESYLFTREAFESVKEHLKPHGVFSMYNFYRPDVFLRYARTMTEVFGSRPCFDAGDLGAGTRRQAVLTIGLTDDAIRCTTYWRPPVETPPEPATDDRPFPYASGWGLSGFHVVSLLVVLVGAALAVLRFGRTTLTEGRAYLDLFCMGAAFLLLETKSVVQFALLFGTTWLVNSLVFVGILVAVYLAIEVADRVTFRRPGSLYVALLASLAVGWLVTPHALLGLPLVPRFVAATAVTFAPILIGNLIFAERFRAVASSGAAFGFNLLGAVVGGTIEYLAVVIGYRNLLVVVAVFYTLAYVAKPRERAERGRSPDAIPGRSAVGAG
jgi:SAM-dependent methyltransferase